MDALYSLVPDSSVGRPDRVDYLLRPSATPSWPWFEAQRVGKTAATGLQQAKQYAEMLGLKFAYATNGHEVVEFDYFTGRKMLVPAYPTPPSRGHAIGLAPA